MYRICIVNPDGQEIELIATRDHQFAKGATNGAEALLNLLSDEMDLEDGYSIRMLTESDSTTPHENISFAEKYR